MNRLALGVSAGILFALIASFLAVSAVMHWRMSTAFEEAALPLARLVGQLVRVPLESLPPERHEEVAAGLREQAGIPAQLLDLDDPSVPEHLRARLREGQMAAEPRPHFSNKLYVPTPGASRVIVLGPSTPFSPLAWHDFALMLLAVVLVVSVTGAALARHVVRRLTALEQTAARIAAGDLTARAPADGFDPIATFATHFNRMAERNQQLLEKQRQLLQAVSHELRTPTARIRFGLEMLGDAEDEAARERRLEAIDADLEELDGLVEELLLFNRLDSDSADPRPEPVRVADALEAERVALAHQRPEIRVELVAEGAGDCEALADPRLFRRAARNLVSNALRHARGRVVVRYGRRGGEVLVQVDDDGPGVPEAERARILEPFARLDASRCKDSGGIGLWLAIVQRIVVAHRGSLEIGESPEGGARFAVRWPAAA